MLPLWIIDLNRNEKRRNQLVERIMSLESIEKPFLKQDGSSVRSGVDWKYTICPDVTPDLGTEWLENLINSIVKEGQDFVRYLSEHSPSNECFANVCVIGNVSEQLTLDLFSSLAAIIKNDKERIIPAHVHQGISITGFLYIPSDVNTLKYAERQKVLRCLKELDIQGKVNRIDAYDRVILYQDTQHRTEKFYPALNQERQTDYLFQCLVNMFFACDASHPLLDGKNNSDGFFYTLGVGSLFYDTRRQLQEDAFKASNSLLVSLKEPPSFESETTDLFLLSANEYQPEDVISNLSVLHDKSEQILYDKGRLVERPDPHPVDNCTYKFLKWFFYFDWLPKFPGKLLDAMIKRISKSTQDVMVLLNDEVDKKYQRISSLIPVGIKKMLRDDISPERGCFTLVKKKLSELKENLLVIKDSQVENAVEELSWKPFISKRLPKKYRDYFTEYHLAYKAELNSPQPKSRCEELKKDAMTRLTKLLQRDATLLSRVGRSLLLGVVLVLAVMPIFELIHAGGLDFSQMASGHLEYSGDPEWYYFFIAGFTFLIPGLIQLIAYFVYHRKVQKCINQLMSYYLHDAKARVANRILGKVLEMYQHLADLCGEYIERCDRIIKETSVLGKCENFTQNVPETAFNLPLLGGCLFYKKTADEQEITLKMFPNSGMNLSYFNIHGEKVRVDRISRNQFYKLAVDYYDDINDLFEGVALHNRVESNPNNEAELIIKSKDEINAERESAWAKAKSDFSAKILANIKSCQLPLAAATIGDKVHSLFRENPHGFDNFVKFCAPNGEFAINDDFSYADLKSNSPYVKNAFDAVLPQEGKTDYQVDDKFKYNMFLTIWRTIDDISSSRIVPEIDLEVRDFFFKEDYTPNMDENDSYKGIFSQEELSEFSGNIVGPVSSIMLYSLIGDSSPEWLELFRNTTLVKMKEVAYLKYGKLFEENR